MKKNYFSLKAFVVLISILSFSLSKEAASEATMDFDMPSYVKNMPSKPIQRLRTNEGSLFGRGVSPIFGDRKARKVNDILKVTISEQSNGSTTGKKKIKKKVTLNYANPTLGKDYDSVNLAKDYSATQDSTMSSSGQGNNTRNESINAVISAKIIKVMINNTYFIAGSKELFIDGEKSYIKISGVIRPEDINEDNTISSNYISDAKIMYSTDGEVSKATHQNWGSKTINKIWPF